jgi:hypothetical protein
MGMNDDPLRNAIIKKLVVETALDKSVINTIIGYQFASVRKAIYSNNSVEISGFGKFVFNPLKARSYVKDYVFRWEKAKELLKTKLSPKRRVLMEAKVKYYGEAIDEMIRRLKND